MARTAAVRLTGEREQACARLNAGLAAAGADAVAVATAAAFGDMNCPRRKKKNKDEIIVSRARLEEEEVIASHPSSSAIAISSPPTYLGHHQLQRGFLARVFGLMRPGATPGKRTGHRIL